MSAVEPDLCCVCGTDQNVMVDSGALEEGEPICPGCLVGIWYG